MTIAINAIFLQKGQLEGYGYFVQEIVRRWVAQYPQHQFVLVFDRPADPSFRFAENVTLVEVGPPARHALGFLYWYNLRLPMALRKYKPDVLVQPYGFCSFTTRIPQVMVVHDVSFKHFPQFVPAYHRWFYQLFTGSFINKATQLATVSDFSAKDIIQYYPKAAGKISVVYSAAKPFFQPLDYEAKAAVKAQYANDCEYFLFTGGIHPRKNLLNLLKAFSVFKKWQRSNMKLLVVGRKAWQYEDVLEKLSSYKFREDVVLLDYLDEQELAKITASAYAAVYPSFWEGFGVPIVEAMQSGVPIITSNTSAMPETGGDAGLYGDPADPNAIGQLMVQVYRDEQMRSRLIAKGLEQAKQFSWERSADLLWQSLEKAMG
jgi:glycosyltransferase involved in cell wall biosynthesis